MPTATWRTADRAHMLARVSLNLSSGEQVIFQGHPSWRAILGFYLKGILVAVDPRRDREARRRRQRHRLPDRPRRSSRVTVLVGFVKRVATTYTITDRRLNIKRGIVSREVQETRLERVQNVNYRQSRLPAADADRRRRLRHRRDRRLQLRLRRRRRPRRRRPPGRPGDRRGVGRRRTAWARPSRPAPGRRPRRRRGSRPAALRRASARSVASQVKSSSVAAEVAVGGGLLEDRAVQVEVLAEGAGAQVELGFDQARDLARRAACRCRRSRPSARPGGRRRSRRRPGPRSAAARPAATTFLAT